MRTPAEALEAALLHHAQELGLQAQAEISDFVQEQRPAVGKLEAAAPRVRRAGKGALFVAEEFVFDQGLRKIGAGKTDERLRGPRTHAVDRSRPEFFSGTGFTGDQDGDVAGRHFLRHRQDFGQRALSADHRIRGGDFHFLRAKLLGFLFELMKAAGAAQGDSQLDHIGRAGEDQVDAKLHQAQRQRTVFRGENRDDGKGKSRLGLSQELQRRFNDGIPVARLQIQKHNVIRPEFRGVRPAEFSSGANLKAGTQGVGQGLRESDIGTAEKNSNQVTTHRGTTSTVAAPRRRENSDAKVCDCTARHGPSTNDLVGDWIPSQGDDLTAHMYTRE
jgi:hypothetical protein